MNMIIFRLTLLLITVMRAIFPFYDTLNMSYEKLPVSFQIENVSDIYVPDDKNANVSEYPTVIKLRYQKNNDDNGKLLATFEKWGSCQVGHGLQFV